MNERESRPGDTPLIEALRRYSQVVYKLGNEGEDAYGSRFLHATFELDGILQYFTQYTPVGALQLRDKLMPNLAEDLPFHEAFSVMSLIPLRLIASDHIPLEDLTPKAIEISLNVAVRVGGDLHEECVDGDDDTVSCELQHVCPMKASRQLGFQLLDMLAIQERFADTISGEIRQIFENTEAVKLSMQRLFLASEVEIENAVAEVRQTIRVLYDQLHDTYPEENREVEG